MAIWQTVITDECALLNPIPK